MSNSEVEKTLASLKARFTTSGRMLPVEQLEAIKIANSWQDIKQLPDGVIMVGTEPLKGFFTYDIEDFLKTYGGENSELR